MADDYGTPSRHGTEARARMHYRKDGAGWECVECREALKVRNQIHRAALAELVKRHRSEFYQIKGELLYG